MQNETKKQMELVVDAERWADTQITGDNDKDAPWHTGIHDKDAPWHTGIYVRAKTPTGWDSVDIAILDKESLRVWLRSRGGDNPWAEDVVGILLGHGHLSPDEGK